MLQVKFYLRRIITRSNLADVFESMALAVFR
jgi:hypothetical protein